jgi:hypothetical protein
MKPELCNEQILYPAEKFHLCALAADYVNDRPVSSFDSETVKIIGILYRSGFSKCHIKSIDA